MIIFVGTTRKARCIDLRNLAAKTTRTYIRRARHCISPTFRELLTDFENHFVYNIVIFRRDVQCIVSVYRATVSEEDIKEAFINQGFTIKAFKFFP